MVRNWQVALERVRTALMRRGSSRHDADDLVQEAWVRLADYARRRKVARPEAFLMRVAINLSIDEHRARTIRGEQVLIEELGLVDTAPGAEAVLLAREQVARLFECMGSLDAKTCKIFLSHRMDGMSYGEIAKEHQVSVSSVEKHLAKAMLILTTLMEGW
jgi:RNA polymerase sigma-70 factor (ECF subfamily)